MSVMKFTDDHEWIRIDDDGTATVGITHFAQEQLGELVFVELPETGRELAKGDDAAVIESVKAASELHSPVSGTVTEANEKLDDDPSMVNDAPESDGWFFKISLSDTSELDSLMNEDSYRDSLD